MPQRKHRNNARQPRWRDVLPTHPASGLFPMMSNAELDELGADIKKSGLRDPVAFWLSSDGEWFLLDGRNRLEAMERAGLRFEYVTRPKLGPKLTTWDPDGHRRDSSFHLHQEAGRVSGSCGSSVWIPTDPYAYVLSKNLRRRHLTATQKRQIVAAVLKAQPSKSDRQIAKATGTSPTTVGKERSKAEEAGDVSKLDTRADTKGRRQPATKAKKRLAKRPANRSRSILPTVAEVLAEDVRALVSLVRRIKLDAAHLTDEDVGRLHTAQQVIREVIDEHEHADV